MVERKWRRIRDSNPRYALKAHTRFPIVPLQPARAILRVDDAKKASKSSRLAVPRICEYIKYFQRMLINIS